MTSRRARRRYAAQAASTLALALAGLVLAALAAALSR
jgi:hypothetical protein